ncbi:MAG: PAS domain S-box protein [Candidatus Hydrogenedentes bacterium]|nr:PAS domain S-box protein [Candidatus Hydrogenedentota bacterium]
MHPLVLSVAVLGLSALIAASIAVYAWRHRSARGSVYFGLLMVALAFYSLTIAFELLCAGLPAKIFWSKFQYVGSAGLAPLWLLFSISYGGHDGWLSPRRIALLRLLPAVVLLFVFTNEWHGLVWPSAYLLPNNPAGLAYYEHGPASWALILYSYVLLAVGTAVLLLTAVRSAGVYKRQTATLIAAVLLPWVGNLFYFLRVAPFEGFDVAPIFFGLSSGIMAWGIIRFRLFQITPVAYDTVLACMTEGLIILDQEGRIVDMNRTAEGYVGRARQAVGKPIATAAPFGAQVREHMEGSIIVHANNSSGNGPSARWFEVNAGLLPANPQQAGRRLLLIRDISESVAAQEELARESRFRSAIIESVGQGVSVCHPIEDFPFFEFTVWNDHMTHITGYSMEEINRGGWAQTLYPDRESQERMAKRIAALRRGIHLQAEEMEITRKDGHRTTIALSTSPVRSPDDHMHILAVLSDMSAQELYDFALESAVQLTKSEVGYLHRVNEDESTIQLTAWNRAAKEQCEAVYETHYPLEKAGIWADSARLRQAVIHNDYQGCPEKHGYPEGHPHVRRHLSVPLIAGQKVVMIIGVGNKSSDYGDDDVKHLTIVANELEKTLARRRADEALRKLSLAVEQSPASIIITNAQGNIEYVNRRFVEVTGYEADEVLGQNPRILKSGETPPEEYVKLWQTISAGQTWFGELINKKKSGEHFVEWASISPLVDSHGSATHFVAVKEDLSGRKALEAQLLQAQKMESVGRLAGGVAHDFNNMLAAILGYAELAKGEVEQGGPAYYSLGEIEKAASRSADLTRQLLAFARKQVISPRVINLTELVTGSVKMLGRLVGEDLELVVKTAPRLWSVRMDPSQVDQVLTNLVVNARDAIPGVGVITIELANVDLDGEQAAVCPDAQPGHFVRLSVIDTGEGMAEDVVLHIFEPFFTTKAQGKGTGLGLATVYGIVKQNNGFIDVESKPGTGTAFRVYLPRHDDVSAVELPLPQSRVKSGTESLLVVEDEMALLNLTRRILESHGYTVWTASHPRDAIELARAHGTKIQLLITDVVMPDMDGKQLSVHVKEFIPGLKCLFMSGYHDNIMLQHGIPDDELFYLEKPFSPRILAEKVRAVLDR